MNAPETTLPILMREDKDGVTTLTLNRPTQFNSLSEEMLGELQAALDAIARDASVRAVVIAGAGKAFCAGHDLKQMRANHSKAYMQKLFKQCGKLMMTIVEMPQPVIARVHGMAVAAGCQLVAMCDLAVAAAEVKFGVSGVNLGLFCTTPGVALARNLQRKKAYEMLVTGEFIDAATACDWGLVNRVAPAAELDAEQAASRWIVSDDPDEHVARIMPYVELGFTHLVFHAPGADQNRFLHLYGEHILPRLRERSGLPHKRVSARDFVPAA